jgi:putative nucleotidyltransferase with HDIG domain
VTVDIQVCDCSEGDILAADVFNHEGVKLVGCNTMINSFIIEKLLEMGIESVQVYDPPIKASTREYKLKYLISDYKENILIVKDMIHELASGKKLDINKVSKVTDSIFKHLNDVNSDDIMNCINNIKNSDEYTYLHSVNVAFYSMLMAKWMNLTENEIKKAIQSGFLHDIGKAKVPLKVLNKSTPLTKEEFNLIKKHPIYGYYILNDSNFIDIDIKRAVLLHHERVNRTGYPFSISAGKIGILTRIVSVADVYDAMTSDRVYKKKATPFAAFEMFMTEGCTDFDTYVTSEFVSHMATFLTGTDVLLSNGEKGKIVYIPPHKMLQPVICSNGDYFSIDEKGLAIKEML